MSGDNQRMLPIVTGKSIAVLSFASEVNVGLDQKAHF